MRKSFDRAKRALDAAGRALRPAPKGSVFTAVLVIDSGSASLQPVSGEVSATALLAALQSVRDELIARSALEVRAQRDAAQSGPP